uniref:Uncharacterized protein n=1 Tax=Rhizophora mucronata TaxID=61149 RepID=A0A2P2PB38_RHIMU
MRRVNVHCSVWANVCAA